MKLRGHKLNWNKPVRLSKLIPNIITLLALCIGFSAIRFALDAKWEIAVTCIIIAGLLDGIDGRLARILGATSSFGAELDSLCDFVNFGVAPALVIFFWTSGDYNIKLISWGAVLLFAVCTVLRLARFNTSINKLNEKFAKEFFVGIPAPAGAILVLIPLIIEFDIAALINFSLRPHPWFIVIYQSLIAILMASRVPTFSFKNIVIKPQDLWLWLVMAGIIIISLFSYPWYVLPILGFVYLVFIPVSASKGTKILNQEA